MSYNSPAWQLAQREIILDYYSSGYVIDMPENLEHAPALTKSYDSNNGAYVINIRK